MMDRVLGGLGVAATMAVLALVSASGVASAETDHSAPGVSSVLADGPEGGGNGGNGGFEWG